MSTIRFSQVTKRYGALEALRCVSFDIETGEVVALLGPNGAGKTTAIEILLGLRHADAGSAKIMGYNPHTMEARRNVGATPQNTGFPDALKVRELVELAAAHYPDPQPVSAVLDSFELTELANVRVGSLSGGQQRRVALALAFAGNTEVVMLDEPSTGLDVESRRRLWAQLRTGLERNHTVLFTTHYLEEAQALATRIIVLDRGEVRFDGSPESFRGAFGVRRVEYVGAPLNGAFTQDASVERVGSRTVVTTADTDAYVRALVRAEIPFSDLQITQSSFEEVFLNLTGASS
jgi:ABC-2 type transport system ATP-binding protein